VIATTKIAVYLGDMEGRSMPIRIETKEQKAKRLVKFWPDKAVRYLDLSKPKHLMFKKTWVLAQLLAWAILDQRPHQRASNSKEKSGSAIPKGMITVRCATDVGNFALAWLLHRQLQSQRKLSEKTLSEMRKLFEARGGFRVFLLAHGAHDLYERARQSQRELRYVYWIVDYLCRCKKYVSDGDKLDIETAKQFVAQCAPERENTFGLSKIEKIWLTYKDAAPYIFAFYGILSRGLKQKASLDEVMEFIAKLASDGPRLKKLIGRAAYAADILNGLAFDVRINDFKNSERAVPPLHSFNTVKSAMINKIDRNAPIA
jgi:hypothetical protein